MLWFDRRQLPRTSIRPWGSELAPHDLSWRGECPSQASLALALGATKSGAKRQIPHRIWCLDPLTDSWGPLNLQSLRRDTPPVVVPAGRRRRERHDHGRAVRRRDDVGGWREGRLPGMQGTHGPGYFPGGMRDPEGPLPLRQDLPRRGTRRRHPAGEHRPHHRSSPRPRGHAPGAADRREPHLPRRRRETEPRAGAPHTRTSPTTAGFSAARAGSRSGAHAPSRDWVPSDDGQTADPLLAKSAPPRPAAPTAQIRHGVRLRRPSPGTVPRSAPPRTRRVRRRVVGRAVRRGREDEGFFVEREYAETEPSLKQIIPYTVVMRSEESSSSRGRKEARHASTTSSRSASGVREPRRFDRPRETRASVFRIPCPRPRAAR